jgi:threonine aldolase
VKTEDLELNLYFDGARLMRIVVPSANAEIIRE